MLESTLRLGQTHLIKGSAKQAEAYATQAQQLASALNAGIWKAKSSLMLAAIYIKTESLDQAKMVLAEAKGTLEEVRHFYSRIATADCFCYETDELTRKRGVRTLAQSPACQELGRE